MNQVPIPVALFDSEMEKALGQNFHKGVYSTGKKVAERLIRHYVKPKANAETQTESIKQLTGKYELRIDELNRENVEMRDEYERATREAASLTDKVRRIHQEKREVSNELKALQDEHDKHKEDNREATRHTERLKQELE